MYGIAPTRAIHQRTASAVLFFLVLGLWLLGGGPVLAQEAVYRCGHEYTNTPRDLSRCVRLPGQSVTVISGVRPHGVTPKPAAHHALPSPALTPPPARTVLAQELARLEKQHQAWAQEITLLLSQTGTAEYGAAPQNQDRVAALHVAMERAERETEALQREWARGPQTAVPDAAARAAARATPSATSSATPAATTTAQSSASQGAALAATPVASPSAKP
jgi:hypothetical protein